MQVKAIHLGKKLLVRELQANLGIQPSLKDPLVFEYSEDKFVVTLKYGVCVFWGFNQGEINEFTAKITNFVIDKFSTPTEEETTIEIAVKDEIKSDQISIKELSLERIGLLSLVLSRSIALDFYDMEVEKALSENEVIMRSFMEKGRTN